MFTITGAAVGGLITITGEAAGGLFTTTGAAVGELMPEFKSMGRGFGKGGARCGTAAGVTGAAGAGFTAAIGAAFNGTTTGAAGIGFDLRSCTDLVLDVLHFDECIFEQSCRSMRFRLCSMPCSKDVAWAGCSIVLPQTITIKIAHTDPSLMPRSSHTSHVKDTNDNANQQTIGYRASISPPPTARWNCPDHIQDRK